MKTHLSKLRSPCCIWCVLAMQLALVACTSGETTNTSGAPNPPSNPTPPADTTAPNLSSVQVSNVTSTSATVTWTTNENASTQVQYGTTANYGSNANGAANATGHSVSLTDLSAGTTYHYRVVSADAAGNSASSSNATFTTAMAPPPTTHTLTVVKSGSGAVASTPSGILCGTTCNAGFDASGQVSLTATPDPGHEFAGWGGACTGTNVCTVSMTQAREVSANFRPTGVVDINCDGDWSGSEEVTTITAWPYRDCFRNNPVDTRTRMTNNAGAEVAWEQGAGWNGQNALRVRPPDGSLGRLQGYAGLGEHHFHAVRTKRLNIRYLFRYNSNFVRYAQGTKWDLAIKYDYSDPSAPVRREGCDRAMTMMSADLLVADHRRFVPSQGVCSAMWQVPSQNSFSFGPGVRENEWISVESEFDLETGWYRTFITTQDGIYNQSVISEINIGEGMYGAPAESVPNPYWWGSIDCTTGCFWGWPDDGGVVPRPTDTYIWFSHFVMSNNYIGPPAGFVQ